MLLGLAARWGLAMGGMWMVALIFGSTLIQRFDTVGIQFIYSVIFSVLLMYIEHNALSLDALLRRRKGAI